MVGNDTLYKYGTEQIPSFSKWGVGGGAVAMASPWEVSESSPPRSIESESAF